jgi:transcriptional regulator with XRE-family HTH domain
MPNPEMNVTGAAIRRLRVSRGLSQEALANALQRSGWDLSRGGLSKIEAGLRMIIDAELVILCRVMNCRPADLLRAIPVSRAAKVSRQGRDTPAGE